MMALITLIYLWALFFTFLCVLSQIPSMYWRGINKLGGMETSGRICECLAGRGRKDVNICLSTVPKMITSNKACI